jgi:hypothetical protein
MVEYTFIVEVRKLTMAKMKTTTQVLTYISANKIENQLGRTPYRYDVIAVWDYSYFPWCTSSLEMTFPVSTLDIISL